MFGDALDEFFGMKGVRLWLLGMNFWQAIAHAVTIFVVKSPRTIDELPSANASLSLRTLL